MVRERVVNYAGFSVVTEMDGKVSAHFHTSNNVKYAVWCKLPEAEGPGKSVTFTWFKMPEGTTKLQAIEKLHQSVKTEVVKTMLHEMLQKAEPKVKPAKVSKTVKKAEKAAKAEKTAKVTVEVKKTVTDAEAEAKKAETLKKIREAAERRKAAA